MPFLDQVWSNLLDNAIKHAPKGSILPVSMWQKDDAFVICIRDHGEGMSEEVQKHIFEKFYQGDSSRKAEGNGLGLVLVKRILDLCKGRIVVESAPGEGAAFLVTLPKEQ